MTKACSVGWAIGTVTAVVLAACATDKVASLGAPVAFAGDAWAGNSLVLESSAFAGPDSLPLVTVGADTLTARTLGRDSVEVLLPDTSGPVTLEIRLRSGGGGSAGIVRMHGFAAGGPGPLVQGQPHPWSSNGAPTALAIEGGRLVLHNFATGTAQALTSDSNLASPCFRGPAPSATEPSVITVAPFNAASCGRLVALSLAPGAVARDTGPAYGYEGLRLGSGAWLVQSSTQNYDYIWKKVAADSFVVAAGVPCWAPTGFLPSPRGDRLVLTHCLTSGRVPIVDPVGLSVAYYLPSLTTTGGAAFTAAGDTLFVAGADTAARRSLLAVEPMSGRVLLSAAIAGNQAVALDPARPWIYVAGELNGRAFVEVFERSTLTRVATLRVPASGLPLSYGNAADAGLVFFTLDAVQRRLYLGFNSGNWTMPLYVLRFDLMP